MLKYLVDSFSYAARFLRVNFILSFHWMYHKDVLVDLVKSALNMDLDVFTKSRFVSASDFLVQKFQGNDMDYLFDFFSKILDVDNKFIISDVMLKILAFADDGLSVRIISELLDNGIFNAVEKAVGIYIANHEDIYELHNLFISHVNKSVTNATNEIESMLSRITDEVNESKISSMTELLFDLGCYEEVINVLKVIENPLIINDVMNFFFNVLRESQSYYQRVKAAEIIIQSGADISFDVISVLSEFNLIHKMNGDAFLNVKTADEFSHLLYIITNEIFTGVFFDEYILKSWGASILEIQLRFDNDYAFEVAKFLTMVKDYDSINNDLISKIIDKYNFDSLIETVKWESYLRCYDFKIGCDAFSNDKMLEAANMFVRLACSSHIHAGVMVDMLKSVDAYEQIYKVISCTSDEDAFKNIISSLKGGAYNVENPTVGLILYSYNLCGSKCIIPALNSVVSEWDDSFYNNSMSTFILDVKSFIDSVLFGFYKDKLLIEIQRDAKKLGVVKYMESLFLDVCLGFSKDNQMDIIYKLLILREQDFVADSIYRLSNIDQFFDFEEFDSGVYITCPEYGCDLHDMALYNINDIAFSIKDEAIKIDYECSECLDSYVSALFGMQIEFEKDIDLMVYERIYACCSDYF